MLRTFLTRTGRSQCQFTSASAHFLSTTAPASHAHDLSTSLQPTQHPEHDLSTTLQHACLHEKTQAHFRQRTLRAASLRLIPTLARATTNPLGFHTAQARKPGTLLDFVCGEKESHPDKIILVRVGEFFEAFGVDALLLVEHCGLNAMGGKARAGCPRSNIQQTLDGLTSVGLTVAVYEERSGGQVTTKGLKQRYLAQIVSGSTNTYIHNATLVRPDIEFRDSTPFLGLQLSSRGATTSSTVNDTVSGSRAEGSLHYTVYEVNVESKFIRVSERLTEDAAKCFIDTTVHHGGGGGGGGGRSFEGLGVAGIIREDVPQQATTVYYAGPSGASMPARTRRLIGTRTEVVKLPSAEEDSRLFLQDMLAHIAKEMETPDLSEVKSYRMVGHHTITGDDDEEDEEEPGGERCHYRALRSMQPRPLYSPTAQQLGLLPSPQVPDLVRYLLPKNDAPAAARTFLRRWLLRPPPPSVADEFSSLLRCLSTLTTVGLPTLRSTLTTRKLVALCSSSAANAALFRELHKVLASAISVLGKHEYSSFLTPLVTLVSYECGVSTTPVRLHTQVVNSQKALAHIVVLDEHHFERFLGQEHQHNEEFLAGGAFYDFVSYFTPFFQYFLSPISHT